MVPYTCTRKQLWPNYAKKLILGQVLDTDYEKTETKLWPIYAENLPRYINVKLEFTYVQLPFNIQEPGWEMFLKISKPYSIKLRKKKLPKIVKQCLAKKK